MNKVRTFFQNSTRALRSTSEDFTSILKCVSCHLKRRLKNIHNVQIKKNYMNGLLIIGRNNGMLVLSLSETKKKIKVQILTFHKLFKQEELSASQSSNLILHPKSPPMQLHNLLRN